LIRAENQKPGTRDWLLANVEPVEVAAGGDPDERFRRRKAVEGYCSHASIRAGETLTVFVSTDPASRYKADFYRLGYYGGDGGRHVLSVGPKEGVPQPTPADGPKQLIECKWAPGFEVTIPDDWVSGVYLGKLTALDSGYEAHVVFIVRDDRAADLIFQCADLTWQAYNRWPAWRSMYDWGDNKWHTTVGADVGFDRPYSIYYNTLPSDLNVQTNGGGEFQLWEFPLAFWMEQQGYDVTYVSNLDTHTDPAGLLRAKGFLSVGHDEYWTPAMFDHVSKARDAGVSLAFLCGNSVYHRIDLRPGTGGQPNRMFGRVEQFPDEQDLMGAASYGVGLGDWACEAPEHWVFEGTGMKKGDTIPQLIGWEYHGEPVKKDKSLVVVGTGRVKGDKPERLQTATCYDGPRGNFVFNAGTCWWNMVLSSPPGARNPPGVDFSRPDERVRRITRNILDRMVRQERPG
jgi:hypothetical protein